MPKAHTLQIVTANDLLDGDVIFMTAEGGWGRDLADAAILATAEQAEQLLALATSQEDCVVGPYLADVALDGSGLPCPSHYRERIRMCGPTNRPDLGRQAAAKNTRKQEPSHVPL
jgi:hypothetical protein